MKKLITLGLACLGVMTFSDVQGDHQDIRRLDTNCNGIYEACEVDPCQTYQSGPCICYCPVTRFKPCEYCETKCCDEPYQVPVKKCRYVKKYFTKRFCKYVPQYYEQQYCVDCPEYYTVCETRTRKRYYKEKKCHYVPQTCWEKKCVDNCAQCDQGCPSCNGNGHMH